jgi:hypothetical protein
VLHEPTLARNAPQHAGGCHWLASNGGKIGKG